MFRAKFLTRDALISDIYRPVYSDGWVFQIISKSGQHYSCHTVNYFEEESPNIKLNEPEGSNWISKIPGRRQSGNNKNNNNKTTTMFWLASCFKDKHFDSSGSLPRRERRGKGAVFACEDDILSRSKAGSVHKVVLDSNAFSTAGPIGLSSRPSPLTVNVAVLFSTARGTWHSHVPASRQLTFWIVWRSTSSSLVATSTPASLRSRAAEGGFPFSQ